MFCEIWRKVGKNAQTSEQEKHIYLRRIKIGNWVNFKPMKKILHRRKSGQDRELIEGTGNALSPSPTWTLQ